MRELFRLFLHFEDVDRAWGSLLLLSRAIIRIRQYIKIIYPIASRRSDLKKFKVRGFRRMRSQVSLEIVTYTIIHLIQPWALICQDTWLENWFWLDILLRGKLWKFAFSEKRDGSSKIKWICASIVIVLITIQTSQVLRRNASLLKTHIFDLDILVWTNVVKIYLGRIWGLVIHY